MAVLFALTSYILNRFLLYCSLFFFYFFVSFQTNTRVQNAVGSVRAGLFDCRQFVLDIPAELHDPAADRHMGFDRYVPRLVNTTRFDSIVTSIFHCSFRNYRRIKIKKKKVLSPPSSRSAVCYRRHFKFPLLFSGWGLIVTTS